MLDVQPLAGSLGVEIRGLDLAATAAHTDELTTDQARVPHQVTVLGDRPEAAGDTARWSPFEADKMASSGYFGFGYDF